AAADRGEGFQQCDRGDSSRGRRHGIPGLGGNADANVYSLGRKQTLRGRDIGLSAGRASRHQKRDSRHLGRERLWLLEVRSGGPPSRAHLPFRCTKKKEEEFTAFVGEKKEIGFGSQIRSYVFQPYQMVKDHRTNTEVGNLNAVMDGNLDQFMENYLLQSRKQPDAKGSPSRPN